MKIADNISSNFKNSKSTFEFFTICLIILLTISKLTLIGKGFMNFPDEFRYNCSRLFLIHLSEGNIIQSIKDLFSASGRPLDPLIKTIPAFFQILSEKAFNLNPYESNNSYSIFVFNFVVNLLILYYGFKISYHILKDKLESLMSVLLFCSLTNSYLYLRHALPFDESLLIFLIAIYKIINSSKNSEFSKYNTFILGILSFLGYLAYPGYFALYLTSAFLFFFIDIKKYGLSSKIYQSVIFASGSVFVFIITEIASRLAKTSYYGSLKYLSSTIKMGSFEESYSFILKYLYEVEFLSGITLLIGIFGFLYMIIFRFKRFENNYELLLIGIAITLIYLAYATSGYFFHTMVFYGRLLHQYLLFLCVFSIFFFTKSLANQSYKKFILPIILFVSVVSFGFNLNSYLTISYPRDVFWENYDRNNFVSNSQNICEYSNNFSVVPSEQELNGVKDFYNFNHEFKRKLNTKLSVSNEDSILLVNFAYITPDSLSNYHPFSDSTNHLLIETNIHWINFKAYQYEGYTINERKHSDMSNLQIKMYRKKENAL